MSVCVGMDVRVCVLVVCVCMRARESVCWVRRLREKSQNCGI